MCNTSAALLDDLEYTIIFLIENLVWLPNQPHLNVQIKLNYVLISMELKPKFDTVFEVLNYVHVVPTGDALIFSLVEPMSDSFRSRERGKRK